MKKKYHTQPKKKQNKQRIQNFKKKNQWSDTAKKNKQANLAQAKQRNKKMKKKRENPKTCKKKTKKTHSNIKKTNVHTKLKQPLTAGFEPATTHHVCCSTIELSEFYFSIACILHTNKQKNKQKNNKTTIKQHKINNQQN